MRLPSVIKESLVAVLQLCTEDQRDIGDFDSGWTAKQPHSLNKVYDTLQAQVCFYSYVK